MLWEVLYSWPSADYASQVQDLPEVTLNSKTTSAMPSSLTEYISMFSTPSESMPQISMPASSLSLPKLSLPSFSALTLTSLKDGLTSSPLLPFVLILLILSLIAYILHTYLITPRKSTRDVAPNVLDLHRPYDVATGPRLTNIFELQERCRAKALHDWDLGLLGGEPSQVQQRRANVVTYQPFEARRVDMPRRQPWVPARAPTPFVRPVMTENPVSMTPVQENRETVEKTPSPAPKGGLVARVVEVVSLRRSTRVKKAPVRFDEVEFPKGRRT